ncbi:hypothetical protein ABZS92_34785, partial [Streptomyces sp. NPDC005444]
VARERVGAVVPGRRQQGRRTVADDAGVDFQEGEAWAPKVVVDRNLVTGQNPASAAPLATELLKKVA